MSVLLKLEIFRSGLGAVVYELQLAPPALPAVWQMRDFAVSICCGLQRILWWRWW
jgi:hypothetical protein